MDGSSGEMEDIESCETGLLVGVIKKITDGSGIVEFHINGKEERAIFFKQNVFLNDKALSKSDHLSSILYVSMPVSIKVEACWRHSFNFEAVYVQVFSSNQESSSIVGSEGDIWYYGKVLSLKEVSGIILFYMTGSRKMASIHGEGLIIDDKEVASNTSLLSLLEVGNPVIVKVTSLISFDECYYKVTHLQVASWRNVSVLQNSYSGTIESLCEIGGSISFHVENKIRRAVFCVENVYFGRRRYEPQEFLSFPLKIGLPVSFTINEISGSIYEAIAVFPVIQQDPTVYHGTIGVITDDQFGMVTFQMKGTERHAIFFKKSIRICDLKMKSGASLSSLLKRGMQVSVVVEEFKGRKECDLKASRVDIECVPECYACYLVENNWNSPLYHGTVQTLNDICGLIEFRIDGKVQKAIFFSNSVLVNNKRLGNDVPLLSVLSLDKQVSLRVETISQLSQCDYIATAVEIEYPDDGKNSFLFGNVIVLEQTFGVVAFWSYNLNKQEKAIFYKSNVRINNKRMKKIGSGISLLTALRVGMCVPIKVEEYSVSGFNFKATCIEVKEELITISVSKHIACGVGTVVDILSATTVQLQFQKDGQRTERFSLADFYVDGKRYADSCEGSSIFISKGDVYVFDATEKDNGDGYLITCVWLGKKPELETLLNPYRILNPKSYELPSSVVGKVVAFFPSEVAIVGTKVASKSLLVLVSLRFTGGIFQVSINNYIQDYLRLGDEIILELCAWSVFCGFPLAKFGQKIKVGGDNNGDDVVIKDTHIPQEASVMVQPVISQSLSSEDKARLSVDNIDSHEPTTLERNLPVHKNGNQVFYGVIIDLKSYSGAIEVEINNKKEVVIFTKRELLVHGEQVLNSAPLSSTLEVGMSVSLNVTPCLENGKSSFKATLVKASPNIDNQVFYGHVEGFNGTSGIISFYLNNKVERVAFCLKNVFYNSKAPRPVTRFLVMVIEVGMRVSLKILRCTEVGDFNYKAVQVLIEDQDLKVYGFRNKLKDLKTAVYSGIINSVMKDYGLIEFNVNDKNYKAVFLRKDIHFNNKIVPSHVNILNVLLKSVVFRLKIFESIFKAVCVELICDSLDGVKKEKNSSLKMNQNNPTTELSSNGKGNCSAETLIDLSEREGQIMGYLSPAVGIITCIVDGIKYETTFTTDSICDQEIENGLENPFPIGETVKFDGKFELFMGELRIRILSVWQNKAHREYQKKLRDTDHSLCSGKHYRGIVYKILNASAFVVTVDNTPVLVSAKYFHDSDKFVRCMQNIKVGELFILIVEKLQLDWIAVNARRFSDVPLSQEVEEKAESCSSGDIVEVGELTFVSETKGVLVGANKLVSFQSADVLLFGVPLADMNLSQIFLRGDKFNFIPSLEECNSNVWYGARELNDPVIQRHEIYNFCSSRSIDVAVFNVLLMKLKNQHAQCERDSVDLNSGGLNHKLSLDTEKISLHSEQQSLTERKRKSSTKIIQSLMPSFNQNLSTLETILNGYQKVNSHEQSLGTEPSNETQLVPALSSGSSVQLGFLKEQLEHPSCHALTEDVKQLLLGHLSKTGCNEVDNEKTEKIFSLLEFRIKECISEALHGLLDKTTPSSNSDLNNSEKDRTTEEHSDSQKMLLSEVVEEPNAIMPMEKVKCVDRGAQTLSTGPVFHSNVCNV